eukprot:390501_1
MLTSTNKNRGLVNCVKNEIHPRAGKYAPVQPSRSWTELLILFLVTFVVSFGACFVLDRVLNGIDHPSSAVTTSNYVINEPATGVFEKHQLPRIVEGFCNGTMKNDDNIPVDVRDLIIGFIREQFHLEWRGTYLFAVHPNPIDFDRTDMSYEFVARIDGRKEIRMRHLGDPEMEFSKHGAQGSKSQDSADHWTSVTLKVSHLDAKREWKTWDITTVDVPNFHETLQDKLRDDLHLPELVIPKNKFNVQEYGGVKYFDLSARHLSMTRFYCDSEGGGSYEVVQSDNPRDQLPEEAVSDPAFALTLAYAKDSDKWREFFGVKFVKADPSSLV